MNSRRAIHRRAIGGLAALIMLGGSVARAESAPITVPGGLSPHAATAGFGDCAIANVTCKPNRSGSCTGYASQSTPPATIRVFIGSTRTISSVAFVTYVENVLPNEWVPSWDGDALKAGAVAVKSYAWYWVTHFGGYLDGNPKKCFDVTDDTNFQVYRAASAQPRTTAAVLASWPFAMRSNGTIVQAFYRSYLHSADEACGAYATGSTLSQYGTQACNEASTGNKFNVILGRYYYPGRSVTTARQQRTAHDFQFLQRSTRATFRSGTWAIDDGYPTVFTLGIAGDRPVITTASDGFARIGVFRPSTSTWYIGTPTGGIGSRIRFGSTGDIPVQAHYSGVDRATVLAVFRPATGTWYLATASGQVASRVSYGISGDIPVPGHYAGTSANHYADGVAVFRPSNGTWYVRGRASVRYGARGDIPAPADYDGNGTTDVAVYRPSNHQFYVRGITSAQWGLTGDVPVTGDFTGDGRADLAVYRPSTRTFYLRGGFARAFGSTGGTPIGAAPYHD